MSKITFKHNRVSFGDKELFFIAGPCVIEEEGVMMKTAETLSEIAQRLNIGLVYKSSFQKDNRSSAEFYQGPGLDSGLEMLRRIKDKFNLPILTDVHYPEQVTAVSEVADIIQIPAYLCMQTTLTLACAKTDKIINIKHGQFIAPATVGKPVKKIEYAGNQRIILTERGYTFGYNDMVVDPRSFYDMAKFGYPVVFDVTHSIRKYGVPSADPAGGAKEYLKVLARSAVGAGIDGLFVETHPNPAEAKCDAASQLALHDFENFIKPLININREVKKYL